jgi:hypothetical protein
MTTIAYQATTFANLPPELMERGAKLARQGRLLLELSWPLQPGGDA